MAETNPIQSSTPSSASKAAAAKSMRGTLSKRELAVLNETGRRKVSKPPKVERRKRRRQIDPTTCEREYSEQEIQFMHAMDEYKRASGRMFPTCSEILEVLARLGYRQVAEVMDTMYEPKEATIEESLDNVSDED